MNFAKFAYDTAESGASDVPRQRCFNGTRTVPATPAYPREPEMSSIEGYQSDKTASQITLR